MKCVICNGKTASKQVEYEEFGRSFGFFKADVCENCGESYFDESVVEKIQDKSKQFGLFGLAKKTKIAKVGNSLAIRIPKELANFLNLKKGLDVMLLPQDNHYLRVEV